MISECVLVGWLVGVKLIAREKTSKLIFIKFSEMIIISPIRTRKITELKKYFLIFDLWPNLFSLRSWRWENNKFLFFFGNSSNNSKSRLKTHNIYILFV